MFVTMPLLSTIIKSLDNRKPLPLLESLYTAKLVVFETYDLGIFRL